MTTSRRGKPALYSRASVPTLIAAFSAAMLMCTTAYAAKLGYSRVISDAGQPLKINVPLLQLDPASLGTLRVSLADGQAWSQAGLTPPVSLESMRVRVSYGTSENSRLVRITSSQPFDGSVADLLLNVHTANGSQTYQVSILTHMHGAGQPVSVPGAAPSAAARSGGGEAVAQKHIRVRPGDTMFAIARRNAVPGVSVYQMMIALQRANPQAFIRHNLNLVKAGAVLAVPDKAALTAVSDREARRLFMRQVQEFEQYRQRLAGESMVPVKGASPTQGKVSQGQPPKANPPSVSRDEVVLSGAGQSADHASDQRTATGMAVADSSQRISELEQNVKQLKQAVNGGEDGSASGRSEPASGTAAGSAAGNAGSNDADASARRAGADPTAIEIEGAAAKAGTSTGAAVAGSTAAITGSVGTAKTATGTAPSAASPSSTASAPSSSASTSSATPASGPSTPPVAASGSSTASASSSTPSAANASRDAASSAGTAPQAGKLAASEAAGADGSDSGIKAESGNPDGSGPSDASKTAASSAGSDGNPPSGSSDGSLGSGVSGSSPGNSSDGSPGGASGNSAADSAADSGSQPTHAQGLEKPPAAAGAAGAANAPGQSGGAASAAQDGAGADAAPDAAQNDSQNKADNIVSWFQEHLLASITALLALIVLVIAWVLRRINAARDDGGDGHPALITEAMVKEKLDQINLDLRQAPNDGPPAAKD